MENFKYIKNISDQIGIIELKGQIGDSVNKNGNIKYGISGSSFCNEMSYLQTRCSEIQVHINSIGGSVLDGYSIMSSILNSPVDCDTYIVGLAASISGVIALSGKKCYIMDYGSFMLHEPQGSDDKKLLGITKDTLITVMSGRTKKTPEEISAMMKKETWISNSTKADYTLQQGVEMGFFDKIISTNKKVTVKKDSLYNMAEIYNKLNQPQLKMEQVLNILKVTNEAEAVNAINKNTNDFNALKIENDALKLKISQFEAKELATENAAKLALNEKAVALVNKAHADKKIKSEQVEGLVKLAVADFDGISNMLSLINPVKTAEKVFDVKNVKTNSGNEDRSAWTIRDWEKKDEKGLAEIRNSAPELYQEMYDSFYKKA